MVYLRGVRTDDIPSTSPSVAVILETPASDVSVEAVDSSKSVVSPLIVVYRIESPFDEETALRAVEWLRDNQALYAELVNEQIRTDLGLGESTGVTSIDVELVTGSLMNT